MGEEGDRVLAGSKMWFLFYLFLFNLNPHWLLFILNQYGIRGPSVRLTPKQFSLEISAIIAGTYGRILLVASRELREPGTCFYWPTGGENQQSASICRQTDHWGVLADLISSKQGLYMQNFEVWFLSLGSEPISGSHLSSFLHILPLKQYNGCISMKSKLFISNF